MGAVNQIMFYVFVLSLVLIGVAYYTGLVADTQAFGGAFNTLLLTATGRNAQGAFAGYPTGG